MLALNEVFLALDKHRHHCSVVDIAALRERGMLFYGHSRNKILPFSLKIGTFNKGLEAHSQRNT